MRLPALFHWLADSIREMSFDRQMEAAGWVFWAIRECPDGTEKRIYRHLGK